MTHLHIYFISILAITLDRFAREIVTDRQNMIKIMKKYILAIIVTTALCIFTGCINSTTNFTNRSVSYLTTPEIIGEKAYMTGSPTANDATVNAEKNTELKTNASGTGEVTDNSTGEQPKAREANERD